MWDLPGFKDLADRADVFDADVTMCNFGADRDKRTRLRSNSRLLCSMSGKCTREHSHRHIDDEGRTALHKPWGLCRSSGWATAHEAQFPEHFCRHVLQLLLETAAVENGAQIVAQLPADCTGSGRGTAPNPNASPRPERKEDAAAMAATAVLQSV